MPSLTGESGNLTIDTITLSAQVLRTIHWPERDNSAKRTPSGIGRGFVFGSMMMDATLQSAIDGMITDRLILFHDALVARGQIAPLIKGIHPTHAVSGCIQSEHMIPDCQREDPSPPSCDSLLGNSSAEILT